jgi:DHA2 family multidrug resistance protein
MAFAGEQFHLPLIFRAIGQPMILVPISAIAMEGIAKGRESGVASALFNMMRNIGGSIGIAGLSTLLSVRKDFTLCDRGIGFALCSGNAGSPVPDGRVFREQGQRRILGLRAGGWGVGGVVRRDSFLLSFSDCFFALSLVLLASLLPLFFMKKPSVTGGGAHTNPPALRGSRLRGSTLANAARSFHVPACQELDLDFPRSVQPDAASRITRRRSGREAKNVTRDVNRRRRSISANEVVFQDTPPTEA